MRFLRPLCVAALLPWLATAGAAERYPDRPIRMVVAFSPGGATDLVARSIAQRLGERWGQQVVVDNRAGAGGVIGTEIVARANPDGYTLLFGSSSILVTGPVLQANLPYHPVRDFAPVALTTLVPNILVAHASVPVRSVKELIEYAKTRPGQLSYASNGTGTASHVAGELLRRAGGYTWIHVPYKGAGVAINDALGGHVQFLIGAISTSLPHMRAGRLRGLAVTSAKRAGAVPELPSIAESGFAGFDIVQWFGLLAPAKTPSAIVARLNAEVVEMHRSPEFSERFVRQGLDPATGTPQEFGTFIQAELVRWARIFKETGIRLEQ
jgi:tripartite-type tricarboxylate transporter receptor subunit TctC